MNYTKFKSLINLFEARNPNIEYQQNIETEVVAVLKSYNSQVYTKLAQKVERISQLEAEVKALKEEVKQETRENITDLFDAEDAVRTRVVDTVSFILTLSKDPKATESPKYKEILETLSSSLTPELIAVLENLKKTMVTVTQKAPALRIRAKDEQLDEEDNMIARFVNQLKSLVGRWAGSYDRKLDQLKQYAATA
jgi:uncharacterized protein (UPF0335 family)